MSIIIKKDNKSPLHFHILSYMRSADGRALSLKNIYSLLSGSDGLKTDEFQIIQMEEWLLFSPFNAMAAPLPHYRLHPPPPPSICVSLPRNCLFTWAKNKSCDWGQLYRSCITYGSVCFYFHFSAGKKSHAPLLSSPCVRVGSQASSKQGSQFCHVSHL